MCTFQCSSHGSKIAHSIKLEYYYLTIKQGARQRMILDNGLETVPFKSSTVTI